MRISEQGAEARVALIGFGLAGEFFHAPLIATTPGLRLAVVVTSDPERAERVRRHYPEARVEHEVARLWEQSSQLDAVVVATPNRTHAPLAREALQAGLSVVVDKPLAPSAAEGRALVELAERQGRLLTVYQNRRWDGDFRTVQRLVGEGRLGEPQRFESRFERWRPVPKPGWRQSADPAEAGGLLFDLGSHLIDQARLLFGPVASVYAELDRRNAVSGVDDDTFVALAHRSGVRSHLWMSTMAARPGLRFRVLGSRAAYNKHGTDPQEAALRAGQRPDGPGWGREHSDTWGRLGAGDGEEPVPTEAGDYGCFYRGLADALLRQAPAPVDARDAVAVLSIIEAAQRSAAENRVIRPSDDAA
jgi:scyllo-inositol 2-dehydrogenase (NADP+)